MVAPPAPPRRPELRHSPAQAPSPLPASPSLPPRARGVRDPLRRSPRGHRFAPALSPHAPTCGCLRPLPSSPPGSEALNIPAAAPPVSRSGAASSSAALPAFSPPPPARPAPLRILFSPYALGNAYGEKGGSGGDRCYSRSIRDTHVPTRKNNAAQPRPSPPPPPRCHLAASPMSRRAHPPTTSHVATAPRAPAASPDPPCPTGSAGKGALGSPSVLPARGRQRGAGAAPGRCWCLLASGGDRSCPAIQAQSCNDDGSSPFSLPLVLWG
ncbi:serine/arginine repetitive matrix protein 1-like [Manacus candei]|uniref:serine/arginine repetitive matrix protein 1-like n=1 Tax=Manacus candei TaxID=415023 RepID=UPI002226286E|nr:serine/arginine repetitive matrix protein 1-like [Manacus candei]